MDSSALRSIPDWYGSRLRPLLLSEAPAACVELDEAIRRARHGTGRYTETHIGVLGEAGVGKSTLLNALLSDRLQLLPQGGVGPHTARAIEVRYAKSPFFSAHCYGSDRLRELAVAVQADSHAPGITPPRVTEQRRTGKLLVSGSQFSQIGAAEVRHFLGTCLGDLPRGEEAAEHALRLATAREIIALGDSDNPFRRVEAGVDFPAFLTALRDHAAGPMSALTRAIEVGWDAPLLVDGAVLVDLPGLGVANDIYRAETLYAASQVQALVLVVDRSGLTHAVTKLLQESRFLTRMAEQARGATPSDLQLFVAVTKLDQVVSEAVAASKSGGRVGVKWPHALTSVALRAEEVIRCQLDTELAQSLGDCPPSVRARLRERVAIVPVFPVDHQRRSRADPDEPTRFTAGIPTGIPKLRDRLRRLALAQRTDLTALCFRALADLSATQGAYASLLKEELRTLITSMQGIQT